MNIKPLAYANTLTGAREFAADGRLEDWVHAYLRTDGHNIPFSDGLKLAERNFFGPLRLPVELLRRCCGPEEGMKFSVDAAGFERHVAELAQAITSGEDMPPLIVNYAGGVLTLNDGNHRFEAYRRLGYGYVDVIVWTTGEEDVEKFGLLMFCEQ